MRKSLIQKGVLTGGDWAGGLTPHERNVPSQHGLAKALLPFLISLGSPLCLIVRRVPSRGSLVTSLISMWLRGHGYPSLGNFIIFVYKHSETDDGQEMATRREFPTELKRLLNLDRERTKTEGFAWEVSFEVTDHPAGGSLRRACAVPLPGVTKGCPQREAEAGQETVGRTRAASDPTGYK
jgi:hypothetical protein